MFEIRNITIRAGKFLVRDITLSVSALECHVIVGPTGSGKTLLLESVIGIRKPDSGSILLNGTELTALPMEKRHISYVPQDLALFPHLTVNENIGYSAKIRKIKNQGHEDFIADMAETVGIKHLMNRSVCHLSGGEKQRVALIRALAAGTTHLVLDEPFSALHQGLRRELWFVLKELQRRYRMTILMVTHDIEEAFFLGDVVSIMINGNIRQTGAGRVVYENPATRDVVEFFGIRNIFSFRIGSVTESFITGYCEELAGEIILPPNFPGSEKIQPGDTRTFGIRPENLVISKDDAVIELGDNLVDGTVEGVFLKGASHILLFQPMGTGRVIELEMADCSFKKFSPVVGQQTTILLRAENFFACDR
jgi:ABC-type Fe3+/spermidine/putrescine transport system ATPase subunit